MEIYAFANLLNKHYPKNGIRFQPDGVRVLVVEGQDIARGALPGSIPQRDYFYNLRFLDDFPQVTHWAFGDAWTQRVKIAPPRYRAHEWDGFMYFASEEDAGMYVVEQSFETPPAPYITLPMPDNFRVPINFGLKVTLARMLLAALDDDLPYDQWHIVTSLVERQDVPRVLAQDVRTTWGFIFRNTPTDLRQALCDWQGLRQPTPQGEKA